MEQKLGSLNLSVCLYYKTKNIKFLRLVFYMDYASELAEIIINL
jgi:hypothetical protein